MKHFHTLFVLLFMAIPLYTGCQSEKGNVKGNHQVLLKEYSIADYSEIRINLPAEIVYQQYAEARPYLQINTDDNIFPHLDIRVEDNCLVIDAKPDSVISPTVLKVYTTSRNLKRVDLSGPGEVRLMGEVNAREMTIDLKNSGSLVTDSLFCERLTVSVAGTGNVRLQGAANNSSFSVCDAGSIDASAYASEALETSVTGGGHILKRKS